MNFPDFRRIGKQEEVISMKNQSRTGSEQKQCIIYDSNSIELPKHKAQTAAKMFQFMKSKKGGRRK